MKMNKKFVATLTGAVMLMTSTAFAVETSSVIPSADEIRLNGTKTLSMVGYQINGSNYYKLRDLAYSLMGTSGDFSIDYNGSHISIDTTGRYKPVGGEINTTINTEAKANKNNKSLYVDGNIVNITAYEIAGNNYMKLRDICGVIGVDVGYDAISRVVSLVTSNTPTTQATPDKQDVNSAKPSVPSNGSWITSEAYEMLGYINDLRSKGTDKSPLVLDEDLCHGAMIRAQEATHEMAHYRPDGRGYGTVMSDFEHVDKNGYRTMAGGENLAFECGTAKEAFDAWVASPGHHVAMVGNQWVRLGVGFNGNGTWVLLFSGKEV